MSGEGDKVKSESGGSVEDRMKRVAALRDWLIENERLVSAAMYAADSGGPKGNRWQAAVEIRRAVIRESLGGRSRFVEREKPLLDQFERLDAPGQYWAIVLLESCYAWDLVGGEGSLTRAWVTKVSEHLGMSADQLMRGGQA